MKILGLNANKKGRGTYYQTVHFMREFVRRGHDVTMFTVSSDLKWKSRTYEEEGVTVIEGPNFFYKFFSTGWNFLDLIGRYKSIIKEDYDLIYGTEYQPVVSFPVYLTKKKKNYKFISHWCDWYSGASNKFKGIKLAHKLDGFLEEKIRFYADAVIANNRSLEKRAVDIGIPRDKVFYIPDGAETGHMRPYPKEEQRENLGFKKDSKIIATINEGNDARVVDVLRHVLQKSPDTYLMLIGKRNEAAYSRAVELSVIDNVIETGFVPFEELPKYLSCADVCFQILTDNICNRSRYPLKIGDYLSVGRATVISEVGDIADRYKSHDIGLLADPDFAVDDFAGRIVQLLEDEGKRDLYGDNARKMMVDEYDWEKILGEHIGHLLDFIFKEK